jgi:hypothetical protein
MKHTFDFVLEFLAERLLVLSRDGQMNIRYIPVFKGLAKEGCLPNTPTPSQNHELRFFFRADPNFPEHFHFLRSSEKLHVCLLVSTGFKMFVFKIGIFKTAVFVAAVLSHICWPIVNGHSLE